jgi:predicted GNAT family acetyltransferase
MKKLLTEWRKYSIAQELGIELNIYDSGKDIITLSKIVVPEELRGQGMGSKAMKKIIQHADQNNKTIALTPSADFGGNKNRLIKFYKQFGFVMNKGRNKNYETQELMIREPK